jgi:hypothetical protein
VSGFGDLAREYEAKRFPPTRRLDVHGDGPGVARDRALRWIQSFAHEEPGVELLLIVERGRGRSHRAGPVRLAVEKLLGELEGRLIEWWQVFGDGSLALRVAADPRMWSVQEPRVEPRDDGRTPETAGLGLLALGHDIPDELLDLAARVAELRRTREGISVGMTDAVLRRIWIEAQADAMTRRVEFEEALASILSAELALAAQEQGRYEV